MTVTPGWRTRRSMRPATAPQSPVAARRAAPSVRTAAAPREAAIPWPWIGVEWSLPFIGLLSYVASVTTYFVPIGQESMILALVTLPFSARDRMRLPAPVVAYMVYYLIGGLSYMVSATSPDGYQAILDATKFFLITLVAVATINTRARVRFFTFFLLTCFALFPVRGALFNVFIYRATEQGRVAWNNIFSNPNDLAALLLFPLALSVGVALTEQNKWLKRAAVIGVVLIPLVIFLTQSRGAILALGIATVGFLVTLKRNRGKAFLGLGVLGVVLALFAPSTVWQRMLDLQEAVTSGELQSAGDQHSAEQRAEIMKVAWTIGKENVALGVGLSNYSAAHARYARRGEFDPIARGGKDAHSTYLSVFAETGILGLSAFLMMPLLAWLSVRDARRRIARWSMPRAQQLQALELGLVATAVAAVFGSYDFVSFTYLQIVLTWAWGQLAIDDAKRAAAGPRLATTSPRAA